MENDNDDAGAVDYEDFDVAAVSVRRWLFDIGRGLEQSCRLMRSYDLDKFHVYEVRIKEKAGIQGGVLLMLKAFGEHGAVIAFHQDNSVLQALVNVGARLANGSINFVPDNYPPKEYEQAAKMHLETIAYQQSKGINP